MNASSSFWQAAWKRLKKNKGAMVGLVMIILAILVAVFGYFISPDPSPYANRIILEIGGEKPGYEQSFLQIKKETSEKTGFFERLIHGKTDPDEFIPVSSFKESGDSILVDKFIDEGVNEKMAFAKKELAEEPIVHKTFLLGTDTYGRDILSRLVIGTRVSLSVGLITVLISLSVGIILGSIAGYFRGKWDNI